MAKEPKKMEWEETDLIEGRNPVTEALASERSINKAWIQKAEAGKRPDQRLESIVSSLKALKVPIMWSEKKTLDRLSLTGKHQGVMLQAATHNYVDGMEEVDALLSQKKDPWVLILDGLQDGRNLGASLRIADAFGVDLVVLPKRRSVALDAYVQRASAGAVEYVKVARETNLSQFIDSLKAKGFWIFGTAAEAELLYTKADYKGPLALVLGSEGKGISQKLKGHCDLLLSIPMVGQVNSLNASVALGIVCAKALEQRLPCPVKE